MSLDAPAVQPARPWFPSLDGIRKECIERRDLVDRRLVNSIVEALGFEPSEVEALIVDRYQITVIRPRRRPWNLYITEET